MVYLCASCAPSSKFASGGQSARQAPKKTLDQTPDNNSPALPTAPPSNVIVKGSFSVWATPPHPTEGEDYFIHIQVKLPNQAMNYYRNDLSGTLIGTDGYVQRINDPMSFTLQRFTYKNGSPTAELAMLIPGAKAGVGDTIKITSKLLQESQEIFIHFD
jgi:hypothetical protein